MRLDLQKPFSASAEFFLRRAGYARITNRARGETSYVFRLGDSGFYPRFHCYIDREDATSMAINIHLDQKQASYEGSHMHSGEYEGETVEREAKRVQDAIGKIKKENPILN